MSRRRSPARAPAPAKVPAAPAVPEREHRYPAWYGQRSHASVQHSQLNLGQLVELVEDGALRLPRFQRPWVWTDAQIVRLFDSFFGHYHTGSLILWDRYELPANTERFGEVEVASPAGRAALVVDGQQRIGSIVTAALSARFAFHMAEGRLTVEREGPWLAPTEMFLRRGGTKHLIDFYREHATHYGLNEDDVFDAMVAVHATMGDVHVSAVRLEGSGWTLPRVIESYRRLNTEGTPMAPRDLEEGLARALGGEAQ